MSEIGSGTVVVTSLTPNGILKTAYVGDSGYLIFKRVIHRHGRITYELTYRSSPQQHSFNCPFQIGTNGDDPKHAVVNSHQVEKGDIIVVASDGLFDNLEPAQVKAILDQNCLRGPIDPVQTARQVATKAYELSMLPHYDSPFAKEARRSGYKEIGGKADDISVLLGIVE